VNSGQRCSNERLENNSRKLTLSQFMIKKGDVVIVAEDDDVEMRTRVS
jgi:hypothetical protein